ncbi:MAG TPA: FHA domain-containing protein, partial [Ktedonobacterales bacterium]|nr:FHA domain-containing protein [Ktedonobacterales bacterium]
WGAPPAQQQAWGTPPAQQQGYGMPQGPASGVGVAGNSGIGFGEPEKTRVVRPPNPQARGIAALITRQGKEPGHVDELRNERTTIGRSRESDIFLEDLAVSRTHAIITREASGRYILRDNNSANGVFVNGERITEHLLEEGDEIQIGQTMLAFQRR